MVRAILHVVRVNFLKAIAYCLVIALGDCTGNWSSIIHYRNCHSGRNLQATMWSRIVIYFCFILFFIVSHLDGAKYAVFSGQTKEKVIALTFDDGPHQILTPRLLDVLKKHDVKVFAYFLN